MPNPEKQARRDERRSQRQERKQMNQEFQMDRRRQKLDMKRGELEDRARRRGLPFQGQEDKGILNRVKKVAGIGMLLNPRQLRNLGASEDDIAIAKETHIPRTYTRGFGESLFRRGAGAMHEAEQARGQDLQAQLASTYGLGSGISAEMQRRNQLQQSQQLASFQTDLERQFREARTQELMERLRMLQGISDNTMTIAQQGGMGGMNPYLMQGAGAMGQGLGGLLGGMF